MIRSLSSKLSLYIMLIVLFLVGTISLLSNHIVHREFERYISATQQQKAEDIVMNFNNQYNPLTGTWNTEFIHGMGMYALYDGYIVKLYDRNDSMVWDAENHDMELCSHMMAEITERMAAYPSASGGQFTLHNYDLMENGKKIGSVTINYYGPYFFNNSELLFLDALNSLFLILGVLSLSAAFLIGHALARRISRPITKTADIAKQIAGGNYDIRFEGQTKTKELDDLITSINHLSEGLSRQEYLRRQFTTDIAHELRTPITCVSSHLEALIEGIWEPTTERLQSSYDEMQRLTQLVTDLERLTHTEMESQGLNKSSVNLLDLIRTVSHNFEMEMKRKNLDFTIEGKETTVFADKDRISQVITNLLSNALKYTPEKGRVSVMVKDLTDTGCFVVEDTGIGIPGEEVPFIFERFYRTDKSRNRKTGGAGIGLAIVKSIVAAHGGTITVESTVDMGSRFVVSLPKSGEI